MWQPVPFKEGETPMWEHRGIFDVGFVAQTMDFSKDGTLVLGGSSVAFVAVDGPGSSDLPRILFTTS